MANFPQFDEIKATQVAARIIELNHGKIEILWLVKLMYLIEKEAINQFGEPILNDGLVSMHHGPVVSTSYNLMKREAFGIGNYWNQFIAEREGRILRLNASPGISALSPADMEIIENIYRLFKKNGPRWLYKMVHSLPEYHDPGNSSEKIPHERVLNSLGFSAEEIEDFNERMRSKALIEEVLG